MEISLTENMQLLRIDSASEMEIEQLNISLNRRVENWRFHPLVKKGLWDGYISYIKDDKWIPAGLWREVMTICKEYRYELKINGITNLFDRNIQAESFEAWALEFFEGSKITPRDYQIEAAFNILKFRKCLAELATSAGKTLISFLTIAHMIEKGNAERILFIVPNVSLVVQASEDFLEYNWQNRVPIKVQQIYSGQKVRPGRNVVIGTYQSLVKKDKEYFSQFDAVIIDETHKAKSASIKTILSKCTKANYRFGLSGTIPKTGTLDRLTLIDEISFGVLINDVDCVAIVLNAVLVIRLFTAFVCTVLAPFEIDTTCEECERFTSPHKRYFKSTISFVPETPVLTYVLGIVISFQLEDVIEPHELEGFGLKENSALIP